MIRSKQNNIENNYLRNQFILIINNNYNYFIYFSAGIGVELMTFSEDDAYLMVYY